MEKQSAQYVPAAQRAKDATALPIPPAGPTVPKPKPSPAPKAAKRDRPHAEATDEGTTSSRRGTLEESSTWSVRDDTSGGTARIAGGGSGLHGRGLRAGFDGGEQLLKLMAAEDEASAEPRRVFWLRPTPADPRALTALLQYDDDDIPWTPVTIEAFLDVGTQLNLVSVQLLDDVLAAKGKLDALPDDVYRRRRNQLYPECTSGSSKYRNRAGDKLEAVLEECGLCTLLTQGTSRDLITFVDVCGGPGAFSEMLFTWCGSQGFARIDGIGMTLKEAHDAPFSKHNGAPDSWYPALLAMRQGPRTFTPCFGSDGTGDVYKEANLLAMAALCRSKDHAHIVVADGGFDLHGAQKESLQEMCSSTLLLAECVVALGALRQGGHFVLKAFDTLTPFMASLLLCLTHVFDRVAISKPTRSRVVNSERYIVGVGYRRDALGACVETALLPRWRYVLQESQRPQNADTVPHCLVLAKDLTARVDFLDGLRDATRTLMERQLEALTKILKK